MGARGSHCAYEEKSSEWFKKLIGKVLGLHANIRSFTWLLKVDIDKIDEPSPPVSKLARSVQSLSPFESAKAS